MTLDATRELYNAALQERCDAYRMRGVAVTAKMQSAELTALRAEDSQVAAVYREVQDAVLHRLELAFAAFFRRCKRGETPGFPRFKGAARWNQIEFKHADRALGLDPAQRRVRIPGVGAVRLRKGRTIAPFGRAFIVRKNDRWYAIFEAHRSPDALPTSGRMVGIDRGVRALVATSDGELIRNPRHVDRWRERIEVHAQALDAASVKDVVTGRVRNRHAPARIAAVRRLARAKEREANARRDWLHKVAREIVARYDLIALEALAVGAMTRSARGTMEQPGTNVAAKAGLNRAILDAGFGMLATLIREKAEYAARRVVSVDAKYTSQTCAECGHVANESRGGARFVCVGCGHEADADVNAARNILARATAESPPMRAPGNARGTRRQTARPRSRRIVAIHLPEQVG